MYVAGWPLCRRLAIARGRPVGVRLRPPRVTRPSPPGRPRWVEGEHPTETQHFICRLLHGGPCGPLALGVRCEAQATQPVWQCDQLPAQRVHFRVLGIAPQPEDPALQRLVHGVPEPGKARPIQLPLQVPVLLLDALDQEEEHVLPRQLRQLEEPLHAACQLRRDLLGVRPARAFAANHCAQDRHALGCQLLPRVHVALGDIQSQAVPALGRDTFGHLDDVPLRLAQDEHVVQVRQDQVLWAQRRLELLQVRADARREEQWREGVALPDPLAREQFHRRPFLPIGLPWARHHQGGRLPVGPPREPVERAVPPAHRLPDAPSAQRVVRVGKVQCRHLLVVLKFALIHMLHCPDHRLRAARGPHPVLGREQPRAHTLPVGPERRAHQ